MPEDRSAIGELLDRAALRDGYPALSEEAVVSLEAAAGWTGWVVESGGAIAALAHHRVHRGTDVIEITAAGPAAPQALELLIPAIGGALDGAVRVWTSDALAAGSVESAGGRAERRLVRLERPLPASEVPAPASGVRIVAFRRGIDEGAYLIVANDAFSDHPESSAWTRATFDERAVRSWFDPEGLFLAWDRGRPVGACWTKVHPGGAGEIYSIAVRPSAGGRGLGKALVLRGFDYLVERRGVTIGMLWADRANEPAVRLYTRLGMAIVRERTEFLLGG
jgi:mycothiol synthase